MSDGYFHGQADDPMVRFRTETLDGKPVYLMQVNSAYRGVGEEAIRAVTMVEYTKHLAQTEEKYVVKDPVKRELLRECLLEIYNQLAMPPFMFLQGLHSA